MTPCADAPPTLEAILARRQGGPATPVIDVNEPTLKMVVFGLERDLFALPGEQVREILPGTPAFFLPGCPSGVEGVLTVRGDVEPVVCLRTVLRYPPPPAGLGSRLLLAQAAGLRAGLRVDRVTDVMDLPASALHPPPATTNESLRPWVRGVFLADAKPVTVLDAEGVFQCLQPTET
ncbi:chemotaxis protein CheW [Pararhodospirillum photometricum]|nr:chemotaxis protein CheW [Pararhodospirillum photometricum]